MAHARWIAPSLLALTAALPAADLTTVLKVGATDDGLPTGPGATISYQWQVVSKPNGSGTVTFANRALTSTDTSAGYTNSATASLVGAVAGTYTFRVVATDRGGLSATSGNVVVTVYSQNPTISDIGNQSGSVGTQSAAIPFTVSDRDPAAADAAAALTPSATSSNTAVIANNAFVFAGSGASRTLRFTPAGAGTATVQVKVTDAQGRAAYDTFTVTVTAPAPEIAVDRDGTDIPDGSNPTAVTGTTPGVASVVTYRIQNTGTATLTLGSFSLGSQTNCTATFAATPPTSIAAGATASLAVRITPAAAGAWSTALSFTTNDSNENPFNFAIAGTAVAIPTSVRYRLDEGAGATVTDAVGSLHATATGGYTRGAGQGGNAITFNGTTGYVSIPDGAAFNVAAGTPFTLAAWVKTTDTEGAIVSLRSSTNNTPLIDLLIGYDGADSQPGKVRVSIRDDGNTQGKITSTNTINDGQWHHVAVTRAADGTLALYVDGQPTGSAPTGSPAGAITTGGRRAIGVEARWAFDTNLGTAAQRWLAGSVDDVWFSNTAAMSQSQLQAVIASASDGVSAPEIAVDRSGTPVADGGGSSITGTVPGVQTTISYRVQNTGNAALTLGSFAIGGASNCSANVLTQPGATVAAGASATLAVRVTPTTHGNWSFTVSGATNDGDENPFNFTVSGNANAKPVVRLGKAPTLTVGSPGLLSATVTDPDSTPTVSWSKYSGPGKVWFSATTSLQTNVYSDVDGTYLVRAVANDGTSLVAGTTVLFASLPGGKTIDTRTNGFSKSGVWSISATQGVDPLSTYESTAAGATATWMASLPAAWYEVDFFGIPTPTSATNQLFEITDAQGIHYRTIDLRSGGPGHRSLGFFRSTGATIAVKATTGTGAFLADSVRFTSLSGQLIDNGTPGYSESGSFSDGSIGFNSNPAREISTINANAQWSLSGVSGDHRILLYRNVRNDCSPTYTASFSQGSYSRSFQIDGISGLSGWADLGKHRLPGGAFALTLTNDSSSTMITDALLLAKPKLITENTIGYFEVGTWAAGPSLGYGNSSTRTSNSTNAKATWRTTATSGNYSISFFRVVDAGGCRTAKYYLNGIESGTIDFGAGTPGWISLGTAAPVNGVIEISVTRNGTGSIIGDSVMIEQTGNAQVTLAVPVGGG